jgi:predicted secreted protein
VFDDKRSKKVVLVAHCVLNQNAISDGTADFPSQFEEVVELLMANHVGIVQLPCPECLCLGLDRRDPTGGQRELLSENTRIRSLMTEGDCVAKVRSEGAQIVARIEDYLSHGFQVMGLIGIDRSPSCGVETTSIGGREAPGAGVLVEAIRERLRAKGIPLELIGVKTSKVEESLEKVQVLLRRPA